MTSAILEMPVESAEDLSAAKSKGPEPIKDKHILYICSHATSEYDIASSFLRVSLGVDIFGYSWEVPELKSKFGETRDPSCIIISPPLKCEEYSHKDIWDVVREFFPNVPIVCLAPDKYDVPNFLTVERGNHILETEVTQGLLSKFLSLVQRVGG